MKSFSIETAVVNISEKIRPFLVKVLPISLLRKAKKMLVNSSMAKLNPEDLYLPFDRNAHPDGVNLIGYIRGEIGLGQSCRLVADGLLESGIDFTVYNYDLVSAVRFDDHSWDDKITNTTPYNINLIHINPHELPLAYNRIGRDVWDRRYNIAFWLWELEKFPDDWIGAIDLVDEIWTPSEFASASIREVTKKPVMTIPYALRIPYVAEYTRNDFKLPENKFLFLCMYDCNSFIERKNPMGAINAFKTAFPPSNEDVGLVIKLNNPQVKDQQRLEAELIGYKNIFFIAETFDKTRTNALIACSDTYVSLHRSEGFGLIPAEAMILGTPVIATAWSANTEFMNNSTSCMVDYKFVTIEKTQGPYKAGNRWAEADIIHAACFMKNLARDRQYQLELKKNAYCSINEQLAPFLAGKRIYGRLSNIYNNTEKKDKYELSSDANNK